MEDRGYLVAHPTLIDPKGHAPVEQQHITHKVFVAKRVAQLSRSLQLIDHVACVFCLAFLGAPGSKWHPESPQLRQEKLVQQLQWQDSTEVLQVQH